MSFDWTKIEGYRADMTPEEKLALLDGQNPPPAESNAESTTDTSTHSPEPSTNPLPTSSTPATAGTVSKTLYDRLSSELAKTKKLLRERMSTDEQAEQERQEREEANRLELESLRREKTLNGYKASYLALGFDEAMADEAANALVEGDMDTMFAAMKRYSANMEKELRAKILKDTPVPPAGDLTDDMKQKKEMNELRSYFGLSSLK